MVYICNIQCSTTIEKQSTDDIQYKSNYHRIAHKHKYPVVRIFPSQPVMIQLTPINKLKRKKPPNKATATAQQRVKATWNITDEKSFPINVPINSDKPHNPIRG